MERFNEALNKQDFETLADAMTEDFLFEDTGPRPDGQRYQGRNAVTTLFGELFEKSPESHFEVEDMFVWGPLCGPLNHHWIRGNREGKRV